MSKLTTWLASLALGVAVSTGLVFGHEYVEPVPNEPAVHRSYPSGFIADGLRAMYHREYVAQLQRVHAYLVAVEAQRDDGRDNARDVARQLQASEPGEQLDSSTNGSELSGLEGYRRTVDLFTQGWRAGGGVESWLPYVINVVIFCESGWNVYAENPNGLYHGLGQWHLATWSSIAAITGRYDIYNPFDQGYNMGFKSARDGGGEWGCWVA